MKDETLLPDEFDFDRFNDVVWLEVIASNPHMHSITASTIAMVALELNRRLDSAIQSGNSAQPVTVPDEKLSLDYLQGQKDGLEWAAQMAEASHPQTGDWLYDGDYVECLKCRHKGAVEVIDSECVDAAWDEVPADGQ